MFEGTLLDSSSARRPVLALANWLAAFAIGVTGFFVGAMKLPAAATPDGTRILLLRAAILGGALMFYALSACYAFKDARRQGSSPWLWAAVVLLANLPGFLIYLFYSAAKTGDWRRATLPIAYTLQALLVCFAALVPLINVQALPNAFNLTKPVLPLARGVSRPSAPARPEHVHRAQPNTIVTPTRIPDRIPVFTAEQPAPPSPNVGVIGVPSGPAGVPDGPLVDILRSLATPPPPAPTPAPTKPKRVVLTSVVESAKLVYAPPPVYPQLAVIAHVQGTVRIHAIIGMDGSVDQLTVVSGNPLLVPAARDAVARWRYQPTLLNREPVEVETEIDVNFILNN
jgi:periplasmic protein TonB